MAKYNLKAEAGSFSRSKTVPVVNPVAMENIIHSIQWNIKHLGIHSQAAQVLFYEQIIKYCQTAKLKTINAAVKKTRKS